MNDFKDVSGLIGVRSETFFFIFNPYPTPYRQTGLSPTPTPFWL